MKLSLSGKKTRNVVGIDVGKAAVKVVELSGDTLRGLRVEGFSIVPFITGNQDEDPERISKAIKLALTQAGIRERHAAMALPTNMVIVKDSTLMPGLNEVEIEEQIGVEAENFIPGKNDVNSDDIAFDYQIKPGAGFLKDDEQIPITISAAKKNDVEDLVALAEGAGLVVDVVDIDSNAIKAVARMCVTEQSYLNENIMIIDAGIRSINVLVLHKGQQVYSRSQEVQLQPISSDMRSAYDIDIAEAEVKRINKDLPADYAERIEDPFARSLGHAIGHAVRFFISSTPYGDIHKILLAGGSSTVNGLKEYVEEQTGFQTVYLNPFLDMSQSPRVSGKGTLHEDAPSLALACGLAMHRLDQEGGFTNLLPYRKLRRNEMKRGFVINSGIAAISAVLCVFVGQQHLEGLTAEQDGRNQRVKSAISVLDNQIIEINDLKVKIGQVMDRKNIIEDLQIGRSSAVSLMNELALITPEGVSLSDVKQVGNSVEISGMASSEAKVAEMITNIGSSTVLESPSLVEIKLVDDKASGSGRSSFLLRASLHLSDSKHGDESGDKKRKRRG